MRYIARYERRRCSTAALPGQDPAGDPGHVTNVELTSLLPGGVTQDVGPEISRPQFASCPEPVIGYGGTKGILAYYQAVLLFGTLPE